MNKVEFWRNQWRLVHVIWFSVRGNLFGEMKLIQ